MLSADVVVACLSQTKVDLFKRWLYSLKEICCLLATCRERFARVAAAAQSCTSPHDGIDGLIGLSNQQQPKSIFACLRLLLLRFGQPAKAKESISSNSKACKCILGAWSSTFYMCRPLDSELLMTSTMTLAQILPVAAIFESVLRFVGSLHAFFLVGCALVGTLF